MLKALRRVLGPLRETQRMDSIYRGPIHSSFTNVVNGLVTLRAYERIGFFRSKFIDQLEKSCNVTFTFFVISRWMAMVLDSTCLLFTLSVAVFSVFAKGRVDNDLLAFSLQIITDVVVFFSISLLLMAEIENYMTSSQRIFQYTLIESEDELLKDGDLLLRAPRTAVSKDDKASITKVKSVTAG